MGFVGGVCWWARAWVLLGAGRLSLARDYGNAGTHLNDSEVYPASRVDVEAAVQLDYDEGITRFHSAAKWLTLERRQPGLKGTVSLMQFIYAAGTFRLCAHRLEGCALGLVDSYYHLLNSRRESGQAEEFICLLLGLHRITEQLLAQTIWTSDRREYFAQFHQLAEDALHKHGLTASTVPPTRACTLEGELMLMHEYTNSCAERYLPQSVLFERLHAHKPHSFMPRPADLHDLRFSRPSLGWNKLKYDYGSDDGAHLITEQRELSRLLATEVGHTEAKDVFEVAHSCMPLDDGVARARRLVDGKPSGYFCVWRRQHDATPSEVHVYSGFLDPQMRPDGPPTRLTPGDDPRLFAFDGSVHAIYNDAWLGKGAGDPLLEDFPPHLARGGTSTICVWIARFRVPAEGASRARILSGGIGASELRSQLVMTGRTQLLPPVELRAKSFAQSRDYHPFGKNYMPFEYGGRLHLVYSIAPLALIECPDLSALSLDPMMHADAYDRSRPPHVSHCVWSSLQPASMPVDPRGMGGLRGSTPVHLLPGDFLVGLGHLRFNDMVATPFAFRIDLNRLTHSDGGLSLAYPDPDAFGSPIEWVNSTLPAREANPINFFYEADGTPVLLASLKRGTDFMGGSDQERTFQTVLVNISSDVLALSSQGSAEKDSPSGALKSEL